jgi:hypothetical protein
MSITAVNLQDNRAVFQIFIVLLSFSFASPSYKTFAQMLFVKAIEGQSALDSVHIANCINVTRNFSQQNKASKIVKMARKTHT